MKKEWSQPTSFSAMSPSIKLEESETIFKPKLHFKKGASNSQVFGGKRCSQPGSLHRGFSGKNNGIPIFLQQKCQGITYLNGKKEGCFLVDATGEKLKHKTRGGCFLTESSGTISARDVSSNKKNIFE